MPLNGRRKKAFEGTKEGTFLAVSVSKMKPVDTPFSPSHTRTFWATFSFFVLSLYVFYHTKKYVHLFLRVLLHRFFFYNFLMENAQKIPRRSLCTSLRSFELSLERMFSVVGNTVFSPVMKILNLIAFVSLVIRSNFATHRFFSRYFFAISKTINLDDFEAKTISLGEWKTETWLIIKQDIIEIRCNSWFSTASLWGKFKCCGGGFSIRGGRRPPQPWTGVDRDGGEKSNLKLLPTGIKTSHVMFIAY
jgi:hypothetical protein